VPGGAPILNQLIPATRSPRGDGGGGIGSFCEWQRRLADNIICGNVVRESRWSWQSRRGNMDVTFAPLEDHHYRPIVRPRVRSRRNIIRCRQGPWPYPRKQTPSWKMTPFKPFEGAALGSFGDGFVSQLLEINKIIVARGGRPLFCSDWTDLARQRTFQPSGRCGGACSSQVGTQWQTLRGPL